MLQLTEDSHKVSLNVIVMDRGEEVLGVWLIEHQEEGKFSKFAFLYKINP